MPYQINAIQSVSTIAVGGTSFGPNTVITDITNAIMLIAYVTGAPKSALKRSGVQYQVASGKTFKCQAVRFWGYHTVGYANNSGLSTGLVNVAENNFGYSTGVGQQGSGSLRRDFPATMYPWAQDPTGGGGGGSICLFGYEV